MANERASMASEKENRGGKKNPPGEESDIEEEEEEVALNPDLEVVGDDFPSSADAGSLCQSISKGIFVLTPALIIIMALRNSLQWHIERVWQASDDFWTSAWGKICDLFQDNHFLMHVFGSFVISSIVFWMANLFLLILDNSMHPLAFWFRQYKIQQDQNVPVNRKKLMRAIKGVLLNQMVVSPLFLAAVYPLFVWRGNPFSRQLTDFRWSLVQLGVCVLIEEFCFYYSHRLLHHPRFYKYIHKIHHEWTAPIGIVSIYCHPIEFIVSNIGPLILGVLVSNCHLATAWFWFSIAILQTTISHSGYHFPLLPSPEAHDFHHLKFNQNFGVLGVLDRLHGTDALFRRTRAYSRHLMFFALTPLSVQIPDDTKVINGKSRSPSPTKDVPLSPRGVSPAKDTPMHSGSEQPKINNATTLDRQASPSLGNTLLPLKTAQS